MSPTLGQRGPLFLIWIKMANSRANDVRVLLFLTLAVSTENTSNIEGNRKDTHSFQQFQPRIHLLIASTHTYFCLVRHPAKKSFVCIILVWYFIPS